MLTLFNISSIDMSIVIMFRRVNKPYIPIKNSAVLTKRICEIGISLILTSPSFPLLCFPATGWIAMTGEGGRAFIF